MYNGRQVKNRLLNRVAIVIGSRRFWYGVLAFFVVESLWVAFSARYPMAFDEDFHMGVIKIYSHHWLPFLTAQPDGANQFGALQSDPSYLYHYLMSFPYRLIAACTDSQAVQVITLRLLNIPLALGAIVLFRRVLVRLGASSALAHTALAVFVLIPIVPLLAGQVNYDNLVLLLMAWMCLLAFDVYAALRQGVFLVRTVLVLAVVCLLASLVKYAFLPMVVVTGVFLAVGAWQGFHEMGWRALWAAVVAHWQGLSRRTAVGLLLVLLVSAGLFAQRYGLNVMRYHAPIPSCEIVLNDTACREYGPWLRNYELSEAKGEAMPPMSPAGYTWLWLESLHYRLFFVVNGPFDDFRNYPPMPLPAAVAIVVAVSGVVAIGLFGRRIFAGRPLLLYAAALTLFYMLVLWAEDYSQFVETGQPVAINGRYLLPVLPLLAAVFGRALHVAWSHTPRFKPVAVVAVLLLFLQGGGVISFILRSDAGWYWQNSTVWHVNNAARRSLAPFVVEGTKYYTTP